MVDMSDARVESCYRGAMSLNIKNERTHALVRQLADLTGESQTSAVEEAVRARIEELGADAHNASDADATRRARGDALLAEFHSELSDTDRASLRRSVADLYDESGLPA